jgi:hypothetical protein
MTVILTLLAVARVTRLVTTDVITEPVRNAVVRRLLGRDPEHKLAYLLVCDWCASVYTGAAAAGAWCAWGETMPFKGVVLALSASYVTGWLASARQAGD